METLFNPGENFPEKHQPMSGNDASAPRSIQNPLTSEFTRYILLAVAGIKNKIDKDPFEFKYSAKLLLYLNAPGRSEVEKAFKAAYGARIKEYLVKKRLGIAKIYLQKGVPKKQIAAKCLYASQTTFCVAFRKTFGMTPTMWERQCRENITDTGKQKDT